MTAKLIDGKAYANTLREQYKEIVQSGMQAGKPQPGLAVILVGNNPASEIYVKNKRIACEQSNIKSIFHHLNDDVSEAHLIELIESLNQDHMVHGILLQLPLPKHIDAEKVLESIDPKKDVDGFHPYNLGRLAQRRPLLRPCTPLGVILLLEHIQQEFKGKQAVVVGASNIVGRPMAMEFLLAGSTVTICHRFTKDLSYYTKQADILVSAVGIPGLIKGEWVKEGSTVVDIGITRLEDGSLTGDIEFNVAKERAAWITPVPGGVGPMTVAMLLRNTLSAAGYL